jgi:hypothetical protein
MARLPIAEVNDPGSPQGKTVAEYLQLLKREPYELRAKWNNDILLLRDPLLMYREEEASRVPWKIRQRFVSKLDAYPTGFMPLADYVEAATTLSDSQLQRLGNEVFVLRSIGPLRDLLALLGNNSPYAKQLITPDGVPLKQIAPRLRTLSQVPVDDLFKDNATAFRFTTKTEKRTISEDPTAKESGAKEERIFNTFKFEAVNEQGKVVWSTGFGQMTKVQGNTPSL